MYQLKEGVGFPGNDIMAPAGRTSYGGGNPEEPYKPIRFLLKAIRECMREFCQQAKADWKQEMARIRQLTDDVVSPSRPFLDFNQYGAIQEARLTDLRDSLLATYGLKKENFTQS